MQGLIVLCDNMIQTVDMTGASTISSIALPPNSIVRVGWRACVWSRRSISLQMSFLALDHDNADLLWTSTAAGTLTQFSRAAADVLWLNMPVSGLAGYAVRGGEFGLPVAGNKRRIDDTDDVGDFVAVDMRAAGETLFARRVASSKRQAACQRAATTPVCAAGGDVFTRVGVLMPLTNTSRYAASTPPLVTLAAPLTRANATFGSAVQVQLFGVNFVGDETIMYNLYKVRWICVVNERAVTRNLRRRRVTRVWRCSAVRTGLQRQDRSVSCKRHSWLWYARVCARVCVQF